MKKQYKFEGLITIEKGCQKYVLPSIEEGCRLEVGESIDFFNIKEIENKLRYLFIHIKIRDGEREHNHKVLHTTKANNLEFVAQRYVASYWGYGKRDEKWWWWNGEIVGILVNWQELTEQDYNLLNKYL